MVTTGEKPGKGTYICRRCGQSITLDDHTDTIPPVQSVIIQNSIKNIKRKEK